MTPDEIRAQTLEVIAAYQKLISAQQWDDWIELWAEDGVLDFPYAPEGRKRTYRGRAEIKAYMSGTSGKVSVEGVEHQRLHQMLDPHVAAVEITIRGKAGPAGRPYPQSYVLFFEVHDGKLKTYREYWNPLVSIDAFGGREAWTRSFGSPAEQSR